MRIEFEVPLDNDGFMRRECPHCLGEFKWHDGPANEEAEAQEPFDTYYCPLCGQPAGPDSWFTQAQVEAIDQLQAGVVDDIVGDAMDDLMSSFKNSKFLKVTRTSSQHDRTEPPAPLTEPDDMTIIASPCHGWEPIKVPETSKAPFYCLVCGSAFVV